MTCPFCQKTAEPRASAQEIFVCGACGAAIRVDAGGGATRATYTDLEMLTDEEMLRLRRARGAVARPMKVQR